MLRNSSGMALLLTLAAISFLAAVTVQLATSVNWQVQTSGNQKEAIRLNATLSSGLCLFRAALYGDQQQENKSDSLQDSWYVLDEEKVRDLLGEGELSITVRDLSGRIQLNRLSLSEEDKKELQQQQQEQQRQQGQQPQQLQDPEKIQQELWKRFLLSGKFAVENDDEATDLIEALSDWLDDDDEERDHGAEKGFYQSLEPPYISRNGPLQYLEELLLVKGFSPKIVYGDGEHEGIINYLTIYGRDGKININTAPPPVLQALAEGMSDEMTEQLVAYRSDQENLESLSEPEWYRKVSDIPGDIMDELNKNKDLLTTQSSYFACTITAGRDGLQLTGEGYIYRDPDTYQQDLLSWKVD